MESVTVVLENPKFIQNLAQVKRACACFGIDEIIYLGTRIPLHMEEERIPRELRMREFNHVHIKQREGRFINSEPSKTMVCVEALDHAENLADFEHPAQTIYCFGPEDGNVSQGLRRECHRFVQIPALHSINLSAAVYIILWDRYLKKHRKETR